MGQLHTYRCDNCTYTSEISVKEEWTFTAVLKVFICTNCKELVMAQVGAFGLVDPELTADNYKKITCPNCEVIGKLVKWKTRKRPCPNCNIGKMQKDINGITMID